MTVRFTPEARDDLDASLGYLADKNLGAALALRKRLEDHLILVDEGIVVLRVLDRRSAPIESQD